MAVTIQRQPNTFSPVNNDLTFIVYDAGYTATNYKYTFQLFVEGVVVLTSSLFPLTNGTAEINFSNVIREYISNEQPNFNLTGFTNGNNGDVLKCQVLIGNNQSGSTSVYSNYFFVWNAVADWNEQQNLQAFVNEYIMDQFDQIISDLAGSYGGGFEVITNKNLHNTLYENQKKNIEFFIHNTSGTTTNVQKVVVTAYPSGRTKTYEFTLGSLQYTKNRIGKFGIGLSQLNAITWTSESDADDFTVNDGTLMIQLQDLEGNAASKIMVFDIKPECNRYNKWHILYTTKHGGWGTLYFNKTSYKDVAVKKSIWQKIDKYNDNALTRKRNVYSNQIETTIELSSDWMANQIEIDKVIDMLSSPSIYIVDNDLNIYPAVVNDNNYNWSDKKQEKLVQYRVEFVYGFNEKTKR